MSGSRQTRNCRITQDIGTRLNMPPRVGPFQGAPRSGAFSFRAVGPARVAARAGADPLVGKEAGSSRVAGDRRRVQARSPSGLERRTVNRVRIDALSVRMRTPFRAKPVPAFAHGAPGKLLRFGPDDIRCRRPECGRKAPECEGFAESADGPEVFVPASSRSPLLAGAHGIARRQAALRWHRSIRVPAAAKRLAHGVRRGAAPGPFGRPGGPVAQGTSKPSRSRPLKARVGRSQVCEGLSRVSGDRAANRR